MEAIKQETRLTIESYIITCPQCGMSFAAYYLDEDYDLLISQVPDTESPFYCLYCGIDVNKAINDT